MSSSSRFHKPIRLLAVGSLLVFGGQAAIAASIINSKHDLSSASTTTGAKTAGATTTTETCVFCHTPHGASASAPLWNRGAAAGVWAPYTSTTLNTAASATPGAGSMLCLSCHDGATALDLIINASGSGGYNAGGLSAGYTWAAGTTTGSFMKAGIAANLGTGVNDHPIGVPYCGGVTAGACSDSDFKTAALYLDTALTPLITTATGSSTGWWLDTGANGLGAGSTRDKSDLPLYQSGGSLPMVECPSCHEPHNANAVATETSFLRIANTSSNLCTTCHNK